MWMCDRCQSINDDAKRICPQCGSEPLPIGARPPAPAPVSSAPGVFVPQFGRSASAGNLAESAPPSVSAEQASAPGAVDTPSSTGAPGAVFAPGALPGSSTAEKVAVGVGIGVLALMLLGRLLNPTRLLFIAIGIGVIFLGHYMAHRDDHFRESALRATGRVVRLDQSGMGEDLHYYPVVDFTAQDGTPAEFRDSMGARPPQNHVGDAVAVYYNPLAPSDAQIDSSVSHWIAVGMYAFGAVFIVGALAGTVTRTAGSMDGSAF